jgi:hypothetical protein
LIHDPALQIGAMPTEPPALARDGKPMINPQPVSPAKRNARKARFYSATDIEGPRRGAIARTNTDRDGADLANPKADLFNRFASWNRP